MPGRNPCPSGCECKKHKVSAETRERMSKARTGLSLRKCEPGCTCGHHTRTKYKTCEPGCTCGWHTQTDEHRRKNSEANLGRKMSPESQEKRVATRMASGQYQSPDAIEAMHEGRRRAMAEGLIRTPTYIDGRSLHPQYTRWFNMVARCVKPDHPEWNNYGGRGIRVCDDWLNPFAFYAYVEEKLGECPSGYSMDRVDNDGNYEPGNLRWASSSQQASNQRRGPRGPRT
jgi:hypothetical protein